MFPISVDSKTDLMTNRTLTRNRVAILVGVRNKKSRITVSHMMNNEVCDVGQFHPTAWDIALSAPAMIVLHVTHHIAVIAKTLLTLLTLKRFLNARLFSRLFSNDDNAIIVFRVGLVMTLNVT